MNEYREPGRITKRSLNDLEKLYRKLKDPMIVHQAVADAHKANLKVPPWAIKEWTKWSRRLVRALPRSRSLTGAEIGKALGLLNSGRGAHTATARARRRRENETLVGAIDNMVKSESFSRPEAMKWIADKWGYVNEDALRVRYYRTKKLARK